MTATGSSVAQRPSLRRGLDLALLTAAVAVALAPGAWLAFDGLREAARGYSPLPFWDHWATVADYVRAKTTGLSWDILFAQSNEHRIPVGRLVLFADLEYFGGRNILPYAGIVASQLALLALFATIAIRLRENRSAAMMSLGVCAALIFCLGQWENLIWAFQVSFMLVAAAGAWSIYLYFDAFGDRGRGNYVAWAGSIALLIVATFSMANGMVAGAACVGVALLARFPWRAIVIQAVAVAVLAALYFHDYVSTGEHGSVAAALADPIKYLRFVATYVGNPARAYGEGPPLLLGGLGLLASAAAAVRVILGRDRDAGRLALAAIMAFVIGSAAVTAVGRLGFGSAQGLVPRYVTFGLLFWAAQALYWASLAPLRRPAALLAWAVALAAIVYPQISKLNATSKVEIASRGEQVRMGVRTLQSGADDPAALAGLNWNVPAMMQQVAFLKQNRLSIFAEPPTYVVGAVLPPSPPLPPGSCLGSFDVIQRAAEGTGWRASGWAWDVAARRVVNDVVIVDSASRIVGVGVGGGYRPDVRPVVPQVLSDQAGWSASIAAPSSSAVVGLAILSDGRRCDIGHWAWPQ